MKIQTDRVTKNTDQIPLSQKEQRILFLKCEGLTSAEIGKRLHRSSRTIENTLYQMYKRHNCNKACELLAKAFREKWIQ